MRRSYRLHEMRRGEWMEEIDVTWRMEAYDGMWEVMERMLRQNRTKLNDNRMGNLDRLLSSYFKQASIPSFTASEVGKMGYGIMNTL
mmetsp:Transcript_7062/g.8736  ORF Transcript_7062/g.8736 Transcript_7062/m.8736 type:complete len:87 (+) Transcript_7062:61-321(+)